MSIYFAGFILWIFGTVFLAAVIDAHGGFWESAKASLIIQVLMLSLVALIFALGWAVNTIFPST